MGWGSISEGGKSIEKRETPWNTGLTFVGNLFREEMDPLVLRSGGTSGPLKNVGARRKLSGLLAELWGSPTIWIRARLPGEVVTVLPKCQIISY